MDEVQMIATVFKQIVGVLWNLNVHDNATKSPKFGPILKLLIPFYIPIQLTLSFMPRFFKQNI
jgi:hypothetical protein